MFDWNDLRHFIEVARTGSMIGASKTLGVNQSTVQRRIAALEKAISQPLVERHPEGYRLTRQGEQFLVEARHVEQAVHALERRIGSLGNAAQGRIRLTTLVTIGQRIMKSGLLERFQAQHPDITVELEMGQRVADLGKGEADVAIRGGDPEGDTLVGMKIADLPWGVYASQAFVERNGRPASAEWLSQYPVVELVDELVNVPASRFMREHTGSAPVAARCGNIPSAVLAVKAGAGLSALPSVHASEDDDLVCVLGPLTDLAYPIYRLVHKDLRHTPRVSSFFEFCQRELKSVLLTGKLRQHA
jgi:DNA-binding transcriptional LysR family regulator